MMIEKLSSPHAGFVAILGSPNVGKSTLINRVVGQKVSIVSPKVQTTRSRIRGVRIINETQLVLVDTPGIFLDAKRRLDRAMIHAAWSGAQDADAILFLIDAEVGLDKNTKAIQNSLQKYKMDVVVAINKIDCVPREHLLPLVNLLKDNTSTKCVYLISSLTGDGVDDLVHFLVAEMPKGSWLYPRDQISDVPERAMAAEITREKLFLQLHQELPYALTVETESWKKLRDGTLRIEQTIYVSRDNYKAMVLGKQGRRIKSVGQEARLELERLTSRRIHLFLFVKVRAGWSDQPSYYDSQGLKFDS